MALKALSAVSSFSSAAPHRARPDTGSRRISQNSGTGLCLLFFSTFISVFHILYLHILAFSYVSIIMMLGLQRISGDPGPLRQEPLTDPAPDLWPPVSHIPGRHPPDPGPYYYDYSVFPLKVPALFQRPVQTERIQNMDFYIDETVYTGSPEDMSGRLPREVRTYALLDTSASPLHGWTTTLRPPSTPAWR